MLFLGFLSQLPVLAWSHFCHAGITGSPVTTERLGLVFHLPQDEMEEEEEEAGTGAKDTDLAINIEQCITPSCSLSNNNNKILGGIFI